MTLKVSAIFQIIGRPKDYILKSMDEVLEKLSKEKGTKLTSKVVHETKELDDRKGIFSTFAETELEFEDINGLFMMIFNYMPANIEVIAPPEVKLKLNDVNTFFNELLRKLHQYDNLAKAFVLEKNNMLGYIKELQEKMKNFADEKSIPRIEVSNFGEEELKPEKAKKKASKKAKRKKK